MKILTSRDEKGGNRNEKESRMNIIISHMSLFIVTKLSLISLFPFLNELEQAKNVNADSQSWGGKTVIINISILCQHSVKDQWNFYAPICTLTSFTSKASAHGAAYRIAEQVFFISFYDKPHKLFHIILPTSWWSFYFVSKTLICSWRIVRIRWNKEVEELSNYSRELAILAL